MQNLSCRNVLNVKFPKIVAEKFAFYKCKRGVDIFPKPVANYFYLVFLMV